MVCDQRKRARQSDCHCIACCYRLSASRCNWSEADTGNERGRDGGVREELAKGVGHLTEKGRRRSDYSVLRSLRRIASCEGFSSRTGSRSDLIQ